MLFLTILSVHAYSQGSSGSPKASFFKRAFTKDSNTNVAGSVAAAVGSIVTKSFLEVSADATEASSKDLLNTSSEPTLGTNSFKNGMSACNKYATFWPKSENSLTLNPLQPEANCTIDDKFGSGFQVLKLFSKRVVAPEGYSQEDCDCIRDKLSQLESSNSGISSKSYLPIISSVSHEYSSKKGLDSYYARGRIVSLQKLQVKEKLRNTFAKYHEDLGYFLNVNETTTKKLQKNENTLYCKDTKKLKEKITKSCERNKENLLEYNSDPNFIDNQLAEIFSLNGGSSDATSLESKIEKSINATAIYKVLNPTTGVEEILPRREYDNFRRGLTKSAQFVFVDNVLAVFKEHKELNKLVEKNLKDNEEMMPLDAILDVVRTSGRESFIAIIKEFQKKKEFSGIFKDVDLNNTTALDNEFKKYLDFAARTHPTIRNTLRDKKLYSAASPKELSVIKPLEESQHISNFFERKCDEFQDNIVELLCTSDLDILDRVYYGDLASQNIFPKGKSEKESLLIEKAICNAKDNPSSSSIFYQSSVRSTPIEISDYYKNTYGSEDDPSDIANFLKSIKTSPTYANTVKKVTEAIAPSINALENKYNQTQATVAGLYEQPRKRGKTDLENRDVIGQLPTHVASAQHEKNNYADQTIASANNSSFIPNQNFSVAPKTEVKGTPVVDSKSELTNLLSSNETKLSPIEIQSHLKNITNEDAEELLRIKNELKNERAENQKQKAINEQERFALLEKKYEDLLNKYSELSTKNTKETP